MNTANFGIVRTDDGQAHQVMEDTFVLYVSETYTACLVYMGARALGDSDEIAREYADNAEAALFGK